MTIRTIAFGILFTLLAMTAIFPTGCSQTPTPAQSTAPVATDTVTITPTTPSPTPEATTADTATPGKASDIAPYSLSKGRRDPFVPFGGAMPDNTTPQPAPTKTQQPKSGQPMPQPGGEQKAAPPANVPVVVTGTFISGGKNFAIVQGETGGPSFMVSTGDKVGEYYVKSVTAQKVVLTWSGRDYDVKMKTMDSPIKGGGASTAPGKGGEQKQKSLPAPAQPQAPGGNQGGAPGGGTPQQMAPPPGGGNQGGSGASGGSGAPGGSTGGGAPGGGPPKTDGSKPK